MARLIFKSPTEEQLKHIYKAEAELALAGVHFDTGSDYDNNRKMLSRDWELDWSLQGAELRTERDAVHQSRRGILPLLSE